MYREILLGVVTFTGVALLLVGVILMARMRLVSSGNIRIEVNGEKMLSMPAGDKLLQALSSHDIFLSSACGGG